MPERRMLLKLVPAFLVCAAVLWLVACSSEGTCEADWSKLTSSMNTSYEEFQEHLHHKVGPTNDVRRRYDSLFWRQPNVYDVSTGFLRDGKGGWTETWGINVWVTVRVDQSTQPPQDRIPDYLEGVPIKITEEEPPTPTTDENRCDPEKCEASVSTKEKTRQMTAEDKEKRRDYRHQVRLKYDPLFWRQPNVHGVGEGLFKDENGNRTGESGIVVHVTKKVDQNTLPPEDRIPGCLEGVPVQIRETPQDILKDVLFGESNTEEDKKIMGNPNTHHRPLVSGVEIPSG